MKLFIDTANLEEIKEALTWGCISGATTNPKIMSNEKPGYSFREKIVEIAELIKTPLSVEVTEEDFRGMVEEAKEYASWHPNIVIKIPMGAEGLKAVNILERKENVRTNVTCIMATNQALLAALSGATYVSIFYGRVADMGYDPAGVITETSNLFRAKDINSEIIVGSVRSMFDVNRAFLAGADIVTVPFLILKKMTQNPRTEETIKEFNGIWREMKQKGLVLLEKKERTPISLTLVNR